MSRAARPRVCSVPPYSTSAGLEAVELAESAGLVLDQWQRDILVDSLGERPDGKWSAFEVAVIVSRQNGKGAILEARELAGLFLFGEKLILHSAHEFKTATEAFRRVLALIDNTDDLRRRVKKVQIGHGDEGIELLNGARLRFVARSTGSGRGFSGDLNLLDEAYALTAAQVEALLPTMSARTNPQLWYTSSPPLDSVTGLPLFAVRKRGISGGAGLAYFDFGAEGDLADLSEIDLDDRTLWAACNPAYRIRITEEFVAREREAMTAQGFARERLGIWPPAPSAAGGAIDVRKWAAMADTASRAGTDIAIAVDTTPDRAFSSIAIASRRADGRMHLELIDHRRGASWLVERLAQLKKRHNPIAIALDAKGPAGSLLVDLEKVGICQPKDADRPQRGDLTIPATSEVAAACGQLLDAIEEATDRHIDQVPLNLAVAGAKTRPLSDAVAWARKAAEVDISPLVAVTLARWAYETRAHLIGQTYEPLVAWR